MDCEYLETRSFQTEEVETPLVGPPLACHQTPTERGTPRMGQPFAASTTRPFLLDPVSREQRRHRGKDHVNDWRWRQSSARDTERNSGRTDHVNEGNPS